MKKLSILIFVLMMCKAILSQNINPAHEWFSNARFGMFIHFGPYSVLGDGEWVMQNRPIKVNEYKKLQFFFNPMDFNAKEWVKTAKNAGMKYITFTSRHHDGFSNWDTKQSEWNIMNTPHFGRDLIKELAEECHKENIKLIFYYSLLDWSRTDYRYWTGNTGQGCGRIQQGEWDSYIGFMKAQLTELLTNYGEISGIWFDGDWDQHPSNSHSHKTVKVDWHYNEIYDLIHTLQPNCMIANNHHKELITGEDYQAFEKDLPGENKSGYSENQTVSGNIPLETCETMNKTWGYNITDDNFKSETELIHYLVKAAGHGANLLLNVGPMPNGEIQPECVNLLNKVGEWLNAYGKTIYNTRSGVIKPQNWGAATQKGNIHYLHILSKTTDTLHIPLSGNIKSVRWLNLNSKLNWKKESTGIQIQLAGVILDPIDSVIEIITE